MATASAIEGSTTSIFWKRRARARSFSNTPRYSLKVVEVAREFLQGVALDLVAALALAARLAGLRLVLAAVVDLGDAVRQVVDDVQAADVLLLQQVDRVRILLAEDRHQHVGAGHFLL